MKDSELLTKTYQAAQNAREEGFANFADALEAIAAQLLQEIEAKPRNCNPSVNSARIELWQ